MPVLLFMRRTSVTTNGRRLKAVDPPDARTFTHRLVNALLRVAQVVIALTLTPTPAPILPFVVRDIVTAYWVKLDDLAPTT
jgi:hypothetical protein